MRSMKTLAMLAAILGMTGVAGAITETFDSYGGGTALSAIGSGVWVGAGYTVAGGGGVANSNGLSTASPIFNWKGQPFQWSTLPTGNVLTISLDFQSTSNSLFDDDRVGWTVNADSTTSSANQFALQLDNSPSLGMYCYWDSNRTLLNPLAGIKASTWYHFSVDFKKLTATSAQITGTLTELDLSGALVGTPYVGTILDSSAAPYSAPTSRFTSTNQYPSFKNFNTVSGNVDNATFLVPEPATMSLLALGGLAMLRRRTR